jgi:hypothetical protein
MNAPMAESTDAIEIDGFKFAKSGESRRTHTKSI